MFKNHPNYDDYVIDFIEENDESLYESYSEMYPERVTTDEWILGEHTDEVQDYIETYLEDELDEFIFKKLLSNNVLVFPHCAQLYNTLLRNETYIGESNDTLTMHSTYMGKQYEVIAKRYHDAFVVVSIYNKEDHQECLLK